MLLATDKPVLIAPAMNPRMWRHPATRRNMALLGDDGVAMIGPNTGEMAERGEAGPGRMAEPLEIAARIEAMLAMPTSNPVSAVPPQRGSMSRRHVLITAGPTHEPIDPVRYIANRSSGRQGYAIAAAAAQAGARVTLVSGPMNDAEFAAAHQMTPLKRSSTPEDIARAVRFLIESPAITGTTLLVDGGQHLSAQPRDVLYLAPNS